MGMAASQARYLSLCARMNDIEYQGQQINQQRTTLSNQTNNYYNSLLELTVPTPPSTKDFTKIEYSGLYGVSKVTIGNVTPSKTKNKYDIELKLIQAGAAWEVALDATIYTDSVTGNHYVKYSEDDTRKDLTSFKEELKNMEESIANKYINGLKNSFPELYAENGEDLDKFLDEFECWAITDKTQTVFNVIKKNIVTPDAQITVPVYNFTATGTYTESVIEEGCIINFNSDGRIESIGVPTEPGSETYKTVKMSASETTDELAYEDAFNQYEYEKFLYDKKQNEINAKISIVQQEDKNLELKLTRLDNERNAVKTELEAVKKVVDDNIEKSFKTFSG